MLLDLAKPCEMGFYLGDQDNLYLDADKFSDFMVTKYGCTLGSDGRFYFLGKKCWYVSTREDVERSLYHMFLGLVEDSYMAEAIDKCMTLLTEKANQR